MSDEDEEAELDKRAAVIARQLRRVQRIKGDRRLARQLVRDISARIHENADSGFGELLKSWREQMRVSQNELGRRLGMKGGHPISNYERGYSSPTIRSLCDIADKLGIPGETHRERLIVFFLGPQITGVSLRDAIVEMVSLSWTPAEPSSEGDES